MIPELTELPKRGYQSATYFYNGCLDNLPDEFTFLQGYTAVLINASQTQQGMYDVIVAAGGKNGGSEMHTLDTKTREKLELFLIAHPDVHYIEGPTDGMNVSISSKKSDDELKP